MCVITLSDKQCRTKVTKFFGSDETYVRRKILSDENLVRPNDIDQADINFSSD